MRVTTNQMRQRLRRAGWTLAAGIAVLSFSLPSLASAASSGGDVRQQEFISAASEFGVPSELLLAVAYNESRWESHTGVSSDGGYGLMDLRTYQNQVVSGRDGTVVTPPKHEAGFYTLDQAAQLLHISADTLKTNEQQNIRGAAAVLAQEGKRLNGGTLPSSINDWYNVVAQYGGAADPAVASSFADSVFATIASGASQTTHDGQKLNLSALPTVQPNRSSMTALGLKAAPASGAQKLSSQTPDCPSTLNCRFIPAAYIPDDPNDATNYGNMDFANRPSDMQIKYIYIHDTEGSYGSAIAHFQDPTSYVSGHYIIRSSDGAITQMVRNEDVSWGIGNWNMNMHGINIEHEGRAANGAAWYTEAMYRSSATLVRYLANKYHIPLDRAHILGHDNVMYARAAGQALQHWDPGPFWDWNHYMELLHSDETDMPALTASAPRVGQVVTISPKFATNQPVITDCQTGTCVTLPKQGASFVYLHTQPSDSSPLLADPYLHPDNSPGTTQDNDWGDKAPSGFKYVVAAVQGDWTGVWYGGQIGWFYNPRGAGRTAHFALSKTLTLRPGLSSAAVYTGAYPEASAYPSDVPVQTLNAAYTISAGQQYATTGQATSGDYFYDATWNYSLPDDHIIVRGNQKYYQISFNHHIGFVKADDVVLSRNR